MTTSTSDLPDVFREHFAGLEAVRPSLPAGGDMYHHCFGCGLGHPTGLRVRCFETAEGVLSPVMIDAQYAGPPGAAHGGIVTAYLDEILAGTVVRGTGRVAVTGELTVRFVQPVPVERPILGRGWLVADHGRYVDVEGRLEELGTARVLATARGRFFPISAGAA
jgi:acyl-coenzyme A thioesterase PaaI-like protein